MRGSVVHQDARYTRNHESRTEVESFVHQDARYTRNHESRTEVKSFVHQDARDTSQRKNTLKNHRTLWVACVIIAGIVE